MAEYLESIHYYPLTGAHAVDTAQASVNNGGIVGDREMVLYVPQEGEGALGVRVNQKTSVAARRLTRVYANDIVTEEGYALELLLPEPFEPIVLNDGDESELPVAWVDEFGIPTPVVDQGDASARAFESLLEIPGVRLGRKTLEWLWPNLDEARTRKVRPLHIVTTSTIEELQARGKTEEITANRFRPNLVINTEGEPFIENLWVGQTLVIGSLRVAITQLTARCPIPSYDQETGANMKDVAKLYPGLQKDNKNTPVIGVYGQPVLLKSWDTERIAVNQLVNVE